MITLATVVICVILSLPIILFWQRLVELRERAMELRANAQVARGKRQALVAQLVALVAAYADHERGVFTDVGRTGDASIVATLAFVTATAQRFPELKANTGYTLLMEQLSTIEAELQRKIEEYNSAARAFNLLARNLPKSVAQGRFAALDYLREFDDRPDDSQMMDFAASANLRRTDR